MEVGLSALWEGVNDDPLQRAARKAAMEAIKIVLEQIALWNKADKLRDVQPVTADDDEFQDEFIPVDPDSIRIVTASTFNGR